MRPSVKWLLIGSGIIAAGGVAGLVWHLQPERHRFYTDAETIRQPLETAMPRDILWQPPRRLSELLNTTAEDYEPRLSWDGLTLYFVRGKAGENADIYFARRTPAGWAEPQPLADINTRYDELGPEPSPDGQSLYFYSDRPGGIGGYDLWVAHHGLSGWQPPINLGPAVNSELNDYGPALTPDGATLYFASNRPRPGDTEQPSPHAWPATVREEVFHRRYDLYRSALTDAGARPAEPLAAVNSPHNEGAPCVSPAGDFLYFASDRAGGEGGFDLYRSRRLRGGHETPINLGPSINTHANELDPGLTHLGFALYFSSDRGLEPAPADQSDDYNLYYTSAREVFTDVELHRHPPIDWAALVAQLWPHLLWLVLALLFLLLLLALMRSMKDRKLGLLARCLLASLIVHLTLCLLFSFWKVTASLSGVLRRAGRVQITLATPAHADELTTQIRGQFTDTDAATPAPAPAEPQRAKAAFEIEAPAAMTRLAVEHTSLDLDEQPKLKAALNDAPQPPTDFPVQDEPVARAERLSWPDVALPQQGRRTDVPEPEAAQVPPADAPRPERPSLVFATSQPVRTAVDVAVHARLGDARQADHDRASLADAVQPHDAAPQKLSVPTSAPRIASSTTPSLDLGLPAERSREIEVEPGVASAAPSVSETSRAPLPMRAAAIDPARNSVVLKPAPPSTESAAFALASDVKVTVREVTPPQPNVVGPEDVSTDPTIFRPPGLDLPHLEQVTGKPIVEETTHVAAAAPQSLRAAIAGQLGSATLDPRQALATISPKRRRSRSPLVEPGSLAQLNPRAVNTSSRTPVRVPTTRRTLDGAPPLPFRLRLPTETEPPTDGYAQRDEDRRRTLLERMGGSDRTEQAVARALAWLARHQSPDGRWDADGFDHGCEQCGGETDYDVDVAITGLSLLCFLGANHTHLQDGPYQDNVRRAVTWLISHQQPDGDLRAGETMYSHGIATIALAEAYGMTRDPQLVEPVARAADFIVAARNRRYGGWRYEPRQVGDTSVLGWQVMALHSAANAGISVPTEAFDSARQWLELVESSARSGLYSYRPRQRPTATMTAEATFVQQLLGMPRDHPRMQAAVAFISQRPPSWNDHLNTYNWYYTTLTLFHHQGEHWTRWNETLTEQLLEHQHTGGGRSGSWDPEGEWASVGGRVYQTALCTLMLEVYYRYLPMYSLDNRVASVTPPGPTNRIGTVWGRVTDASTGKPLIDADVRLDLPDAGPLVATTDTDGRYALAVPRVPDFVALSASRAGYIPMAVNVPGVRLRGGDIQRDFRLDPAADDVVPIETVPKVHHLGNDRWEGRINSQFQKTAEGRTFVAEFELSREQLAGAIDVASVRLLAKGVQCPHRIDINGHLLDRRLDESPEDGSFGEFSAPFDPALLVEGVNRLEIRGVSCRGDVDDFEFVNVQLHLSR